MWVSGLQPTFGHFSDGGLTRCRQGQESLVGSNETEQRQGACDRVSMVGTDWISAESRDRDTRKTWHSFRHTFKQGWQWSGVAHDIRDQLCGFR
jgi:hypothetical protein